MHQQLFNPFRPRIALITISSLGFLSLTAVVEAQDAFRPAQFGAPNLVAAIDVSPEDFVARTDSAVVQCQGFVGADGSLADYYCVSQNTYADRELIQAVIGALQQQTFEPASVDGSAVRVQLNFGAFVDCDPGACSVVPALHHGYLVEELGLEYVAPQPIVSGTGWYEGFTDKIDWASSWMPDLRRIRNPLVPRNRRTSFRAVEWPLSFTAAVDVDAGGVGSDGCIHNVQLNMGDDQAQRNRQKFERMMSSLGEIRFIPGFHEGRPVAMQFFESGVFENVARRTVRGAGTSSRNHSRRLATRDEAPELYCADD